MKTKGVLLLQYLYKQRTFLFLCLFFAVVNIVVGYVYQLPLERALLSIAISSFVVIIIGVFDFYHFYTKRTQLARLKSSEEVTFKDLPESNDSVEKDYQVIIQKINQQLLALENEAAHTEQEILDYFTTWVHQIKVPIAALHLILQEDEAEVSDELEEQLFKIDQYVNLILQYVRLESSSTDYHFQEVDVDDLIRENSKKYAPSFIRKKLTLHYEMIHLRVVTDAKWLSFVIDQLLSNALKYTHEGSISIYLENQSLVIADTGIGISAEDLPRVGQRNFTGFTGRQQKNATGIGFYLSKQVIQKLGHQLFLSSKVKKGTKVSIHFDKQEMVTK